MALTALCALTASACKPAADAPLGPVASYMLLEAEDPGARPPLVSRAKATEGGAAAVARALTVGFAAEVMQTVFVFQQYVVKGRDGAPRPSPGALAWAQDAIPLVLGLDRPNPGRGLALQGAWIGGPAVRPEAVWLGLPKTFEDDARVVSTLAARLGRLLAEAAATGGRFDGQINTLPRAYEMAMQVVAREWRSGAVRNAPPKGDSEGAELFAGIRGGTFVGTSAGTRPAAALLTDPKVAATILYRLSQDDDLMKTLAPAAFYAPIASERIPPGISPAAALGAFRNFQLKLLSAWWDAGQSGTPPRHIVDLVTAYVRAFPAEREPVLRQFVAATHGGTVTPGGVMAGAGSPEVAVERLRNLTTEVLAGTRGLTDGLQSAPP